jgi:hypothetical protein
MTDVPRATQSQEFGKGAFEQRDLDQTEIRRRVDEGTFQVCGEQSRDILFRDINRRWVRMIPGCTI